MTLNLNINKKYIMKITAYNKSIEQSNDVKFNIYPGEKNDVLNAIKRTMRFE